MSATAIGGSLATVITSEGGQAITLAGSGAGIVTSFAGSEYTVATAAAVSAASACVLRLFLDIYMSVTHYLL